MRRLLPLALLLIVPIALSACGGGGEGRDFLDDPAAYCDLDEPACESRLATAIQSTMPTPRPDADIVAEEMKSTILVDPLVQEILASRQLGVDFWLDVSPSNRARHGEDGGVFRIFFAAPVSFEREVPVASDPCKGRVGESEVIDPADPCLNDVREFSTAIRRFDDALVVRGRIDLLRHGVYNLEQDWINPDSIARIIEGLENGQP